MNRLFDRPARGEPLDDLYVADRGLGAEHVVVALAARWIADDQHLDGLILAHVIPQPHDREHLSLDLFAVQLRLDGPPALAAPGQLPGRGQAFAFLRRAAAWGRQLSTKGLPARYQGRIDADLPLCRRDKHTIGWSAWISLSQSSS